MLSEKRELGYLYMFLGVFLFATIEITAKIIISFSKLQQHFFRMVLGVIIIGIIIIARRNYSNPLQYFRKFWKFIIGAGIIWITICSPIFFLALNLTRASNAALLLASNPILVSLGSMLFLGEKRTKIKFISVCIGFLGSFVVITELQFGSFNIEEFIGNSLIFISVFGYSIYTLISIFVTKKSMELEDKGGDSLQKIDLALIFNFWGFLIGVICLSPVFLWELLIINPITIVSQVDILLLFYLGIMTTGVAYILYTLGINRVEPSRGVLLFYTKPLIAMFFAWLLLEESLTIYFIVGFLLIFVAVMLSEWEKFKLRQTKEETDVTSS
ncbi:MAG: membrane protein of unknown function [Promethearchaeota archaeon]|nr:MAG: membrane protein of unknown function [Candidatus Lokiarchaeota archaeon]